MRQHQKRQIYKILTKYENIFIRIGEKNYLLIMKTVIFFNIIDLWGVVMLAGSASLIILSKLYAWSDCKPWHFLWPKLSFTNKEVQTFVRANWIAGILFLIIGASMLASQRCPDSVTVMQFIVLFIRFAVAQWILTRIFISVAILLKHIYDWIIKK